MRLKFIMRDCHCFACNNVGHAFTSCRILSRQLKSFSSQDKKHKQMLALKVFSVANVDSLHPAKLGKKKVGKLEAVMVYGKANEDKKREVSDTAMV